MLSTDAATAPAIDATITRADDRLADLPLTVSLFPTAFPTGPAFGTMLSTTWNIFAAMFRKRREGQKDGVNFVPATFKPEPDGRVRRLTANVVARTAVALDIETNKETGEVPPSFAVAVARVRALAWAAALYTSHSHATVAPRYRIVLPLSEEIPATLPAVVVIADLLGLSGVLDTSKIGPASLFYFPSAAPGHLAHHQAEVVNGAPLDAAWMQEQAGAILAAREAAQARQRADALEAAAKRREERAKAGFDPDASIFEAVRDRLDLTGELIGHGYKQVGDKRYLYPGSQTGIPGVYLMTGRDGVERVYSHHAGDPLAAGNLPSWCRAKAVDVVDVVTILNHGGDLKAALRTLANRFGINPRSAREQPPPPASEDDYGMTAPQRSDVRRDVARTAFRLLRRGIPSDQLLTILHRVNEQRDDPLPPDDIRATALWAAQRLAERTDAR
jgi:hypothetical protein